MFFSFCVSSNFIVFSFQTSFFFIVLARCTWNPGKPWKSMKNNGKPSKKKEHEKKWSCKWKKHENLDSKLQILTPNQEIFKNSRKFSFFYHFFSFQTSFFFLFLARGTWNPGKPWKSMKNNGKPSKTKENEKKIKVQMKKNEHLDSKLQILTPNQEIFKNSEFFICLSFFFISNFIFFIFLARGTWNPGKPWKSMKNNGKPIKNKGKWKKNEVANEKMKIWIQSCRFSLRTRKSSKTRGNFHFFIFFFHFKLHFFSFSLPVAPEIQESHENQWKTMENHQKQRKMKKNEVANEKKMKIWIQSCRFSLRTRKSSKTRGNFHFFIIFFHFKLHFFFIFLARGTWNPGKPWKSMKNNGKPSKTKENEKTWSCKWKKMKIWTQSCRFSLRTRKSSKTRGIFHFFIMFFSFQISFFFIFLARGTWNPGKPWKSMKNNGKPSKTKENEKKWSCKWKNENLDSKLQILTPNQEIFKNSRKFSFFYHFFFISNFIFFSLSLPVAPEIQENHENQWKTMENHQKQRNMKKKMKLQMKKKWKFGLKVADSHSEPGNLQKPEENFIFLSCFFHFKLHFFSFSLPVAPEIQENHENQWKTMENHHKQRKMKKMKLQMKKKWSWKWKKWSLMAKGDERKQKKWR